MNAVRNARRRALWNALTCGPEAMLSYAIGRAATRSFVEQMVFGTPIDIDRAARRMVQVYARLQRVKGRLDDRRS
jgi:hypothetical protein